MYAKLMKKFENRLIIYTDALKRLDDKSCGYENLKIVFECVKEEWRTFDKLITEMLSYGLMTEEEYKKVHEDGYKKYKEYFNICTQILANYK